MDQEAIPEVVGTHYHTCPVLGEDWYHWTCPDCGCPFNTASEFDDGKVLECQHDPLAEYPRMICGQKVRFRISGA